MCLIEWNYVTELNSTQKLEKRYPTEFHFPRVFASMSHSRQVHAGKPLSVHPWFPLFLKPIVTYSFWVTFFPDIWLIPFFVAPPPHVSQDVYSFAQTQFWFTKTDAFSWCLHLYHLGCGIMVSLHADGNRSLSFGFWSLCLHKSQTGGFGLENQVMPYHPPCISFHNDFTHT